LPSMSAPVTEVWIKRECNG